MQKSCRYISLSEITATQFTTFINNDLVKLVTPEELLNAPRRLTEEEFEIVKNHSAIGYRIFKDSNLTILKWLYQK